jgi:rhamnulokinase
MIYFRKGIYHAFCRTLSIGEGISFKDLAELARSSIYEGVVDVDDNRFFAPDKMVEVVCEVCFENGFKKPESLGDIARCIYRSLALSYAKTIKDLELLTDRKYESINIIGGGSNNTYLNELTAEACGLPVYAGPSEGTALGNIISQMINDGELHSVEEAREAVIRSFDIKTYM